MAEAKKPNWFKETFTGLFKLNGQINQQQRWIAIAIWTLLLVSLWNPLRPTMVPSLGELFSAYGPLFKSLDFTAHWFSTIKLTLKAIGLSVIFSVLISYLSVIPFFRPVAYVISKARFLSLMGFIVLFLSISHNAVTTRLYLLMFGIIPYLVTSMNSIILATDEKMFQYARTLNLSPWQTTFHVLIASKAGEIFEAVRQNLAIAFMMIVLVENKLREGGGIGVLLFDLKKYGHGFDKIFAVQLSVLLVGVCIDFVMHKINQVAFPYAFLKRQGGGK